jgi:hypothetical protein
MKQMVQIFCHRCDKLFPPDEFWVDDVTDEVSIAGICPDCGLPATVDTKLMDLSEVVRQINPPPSLVGKAAHELDIRFLETEGTVH